MKKQLTWLALAVAMAVVIVAGAMAWLRTRAAHEFHRPYQVEIAGRSMVVRLEKVVVGKGTAGHLLLLSVRMEDEAGREVAANNRSLVLVDDGGRQYAPAGGLSLAYEVPASLLAGPIWLQVGSSQRLPVKNSRPFVQELRNGEFRTFVTTDW